MFTIEQMDGITPNAYSGCRKCRAGVCDLCFDEEMPSFFLHAVNFFQFSSITVLIVIIFCLLDYKLVHHLSLLINIIHYQILF